MALELGSLGVAAAFEECLVSIEDMEDRGAGMALEPKSSGAAAALDKVC